MQQFLKKMIQSLLEHVEPTLLISLKRGNYKKCSLLPTPKVKFT